MTKDERDKRWQEIFDNYDQAMAKFSEHRTLTQQLGPLLAQFIARGDSQALAAQGMADAMYRANRAALALYREEREG